LVALSDRNILDPIKTIVDRNAYNLMFVIFLVEWILDGEIHSAYTWLATKVARALKPDEQSAIDGYEIKDNITFVAIVTDLEEEDGNTHDVNPIINITN